MLDALHRGSLQMFGGYDIFVLIVVFLAILTVFLGNAIVLVPMVLNGDAGARYGIPFPVFARASFGVRGANIPAMLSALSEMESTAPSTVRGTESSMDSGL